MRQNGFELSTIAQATGLSLEKINRIIAENQLNQELPT